MSDRRRNTTYARAVTEYDGAFERQLVEAITTAIVEASRVTDGNAVVIRTGEATSALLTLLVGMLAMSPAVTRSPTAIRKTIDELGKRLRRRIAAAEVNGELQEFLRRTFRSSDVGGPA